MRLWNGSTDCLRNLHSTQLYFWIQRSSAAAPSSYPFGTTGFPEYKQNLQSYLANMQSSKSCRTLQRLYANSSALVDRPLLAIELRSILSLSPFSKGPLESALHRPAAQLYTLRQWTPDANPSPDLWD